MAVFLYSRKVLAFYFEQTDINWIGEFSMSMLQRSIPSFSIISLCVAIPLTLTSARTMLLYESWSRKRVEVKCIHKHEEGTKGQDVSGGGEREVKAYKEYERERERVPKLKRD